MNRKIWNRISYTMTAAILLAALCVPAMATEQGYQPEAIHKQVPGGYFYTAGRAYLGVDIKDVTTDRVAALKLKEERGVEITMVDMDAPAGKAGLREHDVILDFNGTAVESEEQIRRLIREVPPGRSVTLGISRDGSPMKVSVQLADHSAMVAQVRPGIIFPPSRPSDPSRNGMDIPGIQIQIYSAALGVQTENLTRQLGEFFGVKNGEGVLIRSVEKGSAAEKAGLKAGDVIVRADNEKLTDRSDLSHILRNHRTGGKVTLVVMRDKHEQTFVVTLADRGSRDSSALTLDSEELQASLGNVEEMLQGLEDDENLISLDGELASLDGNIALLDMANQGSLLQITPEMEKAWQQMEKSLQDLSLRDLKIGCDPI
ncbi:MAG TPA: PDZ domain-containing protein [Candidatus Angelobacter sp.]|nr:PDZ domain-containing protein [Candidatus Angelobacter sp.]